MNAVTSGAAQRGISARIVERLSQELGPTRFGLWFGHSARVGMEEESHTVRVTVPSRFHADWIDRHFRDQICSAATETVGFDVGLELEVEPEAFEPDSDAPGEPKSQGAQDEDQRHSFLAEYRKRQSGNGNNTRHAFDDRFDLGRFIVGNSNELAYHAARRVASGQVGFNPLFIHGGCGLGKTHLLQGICREFRRHNPMARIRYVTGEQFTNEYIAAVRNHRLEQFRQKIRQLDLLALDDVHFLSNKQSTQNEFLCTFDAIDMTGARLILASDEHPKHIGQFHQRLVSRFMSGMVVEVHAPDRGMRRQIIEQLAATRGLCLHEVAIDALAERCIGSVREIEGALTRLQAMQTLLEGETALAGEASEIGMILVDRLFDSETPVSTRPIPMHAIVEAVARRWGLEASQILGSGRHRNVVQARSTAAYLARHLTAQSFPEIATAMGRKNHSTIVAAVGRVEQSLARDSTIELKPGDPPQPWRTILDSLKHGLTTSRHCSSNTP